MPSVDWNKATWDGSYDWGQHGDEWSADWGGVDAHWHWTLWPRLHPYLPAPTVLEIAPGYGRWTARLKGLCQTLILVELSEQCLQACRDRFRADTHLHYHKTDGKDLSMVPDGAVDFAFSFDSLVHVEIDVLESYIGQLRHKLGPHGVAFLHHSNLAEYGTYYGLVNRLPRGKSALTRWGLIEWNYHCRASSVSAAKVEALVRKAGMQCVGQELVNWGSKRLTDCITVFTPSGSRWARPNRVMRNGDFMAEAARAAALSAHYGPPKSAVNRPTAPTESPSTA